MGYADREHTDQETVTQNGCYIPDLRLEKQSPVRHRAKIEHTDARDSMGNGGEQAHSRQWQAWGKLAPHVAAVAR